VNAPPGSGGRSIPRSRDWKININARVEPEL